MKKFLLVIMLLASFSILLVGCGNSGSSKSASGTTSSSSSSSSNSSNSSSSNSSSSNSASSGKHYTFRLADDQPTGYPTVVGDQKFAKLVNQRTNGRITIKIYPNAQLGDEKSVFEQVQLGAVDFERINSSALSNYDKQIGVFSLPYLFKNEQQKWDVLNGKVGQKLLDGLTSAKAVGLTYYDSGSRNFYNSKHAVSKPSDLKGLKIRVQQSDMMVDLVNTLGASATPIDYAEVYNSLQTGVIDGAENNWPSYYSTNHYKVAKYFTEDHHTMNPEVLLMSSKKWNKLSASDQKIIRQAAVDSQKTQRASWKALQDKAKKAVKANGNVITPVTDIAAWQKAVQPLYKKYGSQYSDLIKQIQAVK